MKGFLAAIVFFWTAAIFSQDIIIVDTLDHGYKKELTDLYNKRVAEQKIIFDRNISDRKVRKEVEATYQQLSSDLIENINKGVFVKNETYNAFLDDILLNIKNSNPEYPDIARTKILLSFGKTPNAYAIGNNIIVVVVPLISSLNNEYELAFIISHEIAHNLLLHSYNGIIEYATMMHSSEIRKQTRQIEKQKYNKAQMASGLYRDIVYHKRKNSRKLEVQADSLGFVLYKNAFKGREYEALRSLETLGEIDKERDSLTASDYFKLFNTDKLPFKKEWIESNELSSYKYDKTLRFWQIDSLKTHPDCGLRASIVQKHFMVKPAGLDLPSDKFILLKRSGAYNHVLGLFVIEAYGRSLYEALLLLKNDPDNVLINKMVYKGLCKLRDAQRTYTLNKYLETESPNFSKSYNTFLHFLRQLRKSEMAEIINQYSIKA